MGRPRGPAKIGDLTVYLSEDGTWAASFFDRLGVEHVVGFDFATPGAALDRACAWVASRGAELRLAPISAFRVKPT